MEEEILHSSFYQSHHVAVLRSHLRHILNTALILLNLEHCRLSIVTENDEDTLSIHCNAALESPEPDAATVVWPANGNTEEAFQFRQRLQYARKTESANTARIMGPDAFAAADGGHHAPPSRQDTALFVKLMLVRKRRAGQLTYGERNAVQRMLHYIDRAIAAHLESRRRDYRSAMLERLMAHHGMGVIRLDQTLEIVEKSALVDELLATTKDYRCQSNRLVKVAPHGEHVIELAVDALNARNLSCWIIDVVATPGDAQCAIVLAPLAPGRGASGNGYLVYVLYSIADRFNASDLLNFWRITPAEKRALAGLTRYGNIKKVAIQLGISPNTVKSQVKSAYRKLGVDNKIALLRRFALLRLIDALTRAG